MVRFVEVLPVGVFADAVSGGPKLGGIRRFENVSSSISFSSHSLKNLFKLSSGLICTLFVPEALWGASPALPLFLSFRRRGSFMFGSQIVHVENAVERSFLLGGSPAHSVFSV